MSARIVYHGSRKPFIPREEYLDGDRHADLAPHAEGQLWQRVLVSA